MRDADGRELMTDADPAFWAGHAPLLFPIVGRLNGDTLRVDGVEYPMKQHGFARHSTFTVVEQDTQRAVFTLEDDAQTRTAYPFAFTLRVSHEIRDATLSIHVEIANSETERAMPASFGFHPAFAWPLPYGMPREAHRILFEAAEQDSICELRGGLVGSERRPAPLRDRTLPLDDALFARDALIWDSVRSRSVRYGASTGPQLRIAFPDTPMLGVWSKPGAAFVCIEPWHGMADPQGFTEDFRDKPGIFSVAAGATRAVGMSITFEP